jgi:putative transposase
MALIERYPIATVCQVLDYPRSQVYYHPQAVEDESDLKGAILTLAGGSIDAGMRPDGQAAGQAETNYPQSA